MAAYFGDSSEGYMQQRRRRTWQEHAQERALAHYVSSSMSGYGDTIIDPAISSIVGAEVAAEDSSGGAGPFNSIAVGVATGVLTFLLNRWLGKVLG